MPLESGEQRHETRDSPIPEEAEGKMVGDQLGRTGSGGTQPWEVLHGQMSVKAGGTGCRRRAGAKERGLERSQEKVRVPKGEGTRLIFCQLDTCVLAGSGTVSPGLRPDTLISSLLPWPLSPPSSSLTKSCCFQFHVAWILPSRLAPRYKSAAVGPEGHTRTVLRPPPWFHSCGTDLPLRKSPPSPVGDPDTPSPQDLCGFKDMR